MRKLRSREVKILAQVHRANKWQKQDLNTKQGPHQMETDIGIVTMHSLNKYLLCTYSEVSVVQGPGYIVENKNLDFSVKDSNRIRQISN